MFVCDYCGGERIREAVFVNYNTREELGELEWDVYCDDCDGECTVSERESSGTQANPNSTTKDELC